MQSSMNEYPINFILISVFMITYAHSEICGQEELVQCSRQIQVLAETSEFNFVDNKEELDRVCPDLHMGLECIRSYTRRCMSQHQREHFNKLYHGTNEMIHELCKEGSYQQDFLRHAPCMRKVKKDYEVCSRMYQTTMSRLSGEPAATTPPTTTTTTAIPLIMRSNYLRQQQHQHPNTTISSNTSYVSLETTTSIPMSKNNNVSNQSDEEDHIKTVCCAFQKFMECSEVAITRACGRETAEFSRKFLDKMLSTLMRMHCDSPEKRQCDEYANGTGYNRNRNSLIFITIVFSIIAYLL